MPSRARAGKSRKVSRKEYESVLDIVLDNPAENEPHRLVNLAKDDRLERV